MLNAILNRLKASSRAVIIEKTHMKENMWD